MQAVYSLEFDGASKGNPGPAGAGAVLRKPDGTIVSAPSSIQLQGLRYQGYSQHVPFNTRRQQPVKPFYEKISVQVATYRFGIATFFGVLPFKAGFRGASQHFPGTPAQSMNLLHWSKASPSRCVSSRVCQEEEIIEFVGPKATNNAAEYRGLIIGLKAARARGIRRLHARGDSKLVVCQVSFSPANTSWP
jgi:ribonuclease HI